MGWARRHSALGGDVLVAVLGLLSGVGVQVRLGPTLRCAPSQTETPPQRARKLVYYRDERYVFDVGTTVVPLDGGTTP